MPNHYAGVTCPQCGSNDTYFVESEQDEVPICECEVCGCRFQKEDDT